jgi:hypothetical protein
MPVERLPAVVEVVKNPKPHAPSPSRLCLFSIVIPAKAGTQRPRVLDQIITEVAPLRILSLNQLQLPDPAPFLDPLFTEDRVWHGFVEFGENQPGNTIPPNKSAGAVGSVLPNTTHQVVRDTDVKRAVALAGEDAYAGSSLLSAAD